MLFAAHKEIVTPVHQKYIKNISYVKYIVISFTIDNCHTENIHFVSNHYKVINLIK